MRMTLMILGFIAFFSFASCKSVPSEELDDIPEEVSEANVYTISLATNDDWELSRVGDIFYEAKSQIEEESQGQFCVEIYDEGILGDGNNLIHAASIGSISVAVTSPASQSSVVPEAVLLGIPGIFADRDVFQVFINSYYEVMDSYYQEHNLKLLCCVAVSGKVLATSSEISTSDEFQHMSVAVENYPYNGMFWDCLGCDTVLCDAGSIYQAIVDGEINAQLISYDKFCSTKSYRLQRYLIPVNSALEVVTCAMNLEEYNRLDKENAAYLDLFFQNVRNSLINSEQEECNDQRVSVDLNVIYPGYEFYDAFFQAKEQMLQDMKGIIPDGRMDDFLNQVSRIQNE